MQKQSQLYPEKGEIPKIGRVFRYKTQLHTTSTSSNVMIMSAKCKFLSTFTP